MSTTRSNDADEFESWIGVDGKYRWVSPAVERLTGYTPTEIMAMPAFAPLLIAAEDRNLAVARLQDAVSGAKAESHGSTEIKCIHKNGSAFWMHLSWEQIFDAQGQPLGIRTKEKNINDLKVSEDERLLAAIALNAISQGALITGADRLIISANDAFCSITGYSREEIIGKDCRFLQGPDTDPRTVQEIREALGNTSEFNGKLLNYKKNGSLFWNELSIVPIRDQKGGVTNFVGITRDVTEAHNRTIELEKTTLRASAADRTKREFLGMMSQQLRTPLDAIIGFSSALLKEHKLAPEVMDKILFIQSTGESLLRSVDDILEYSKVAGEGLSLQHVPFSLSDVAWKAIRHVEPDAKAKSLELSVVIGEAVPGTVSGDPDRIQQVLINLLHNAVTYTGRGNISLIISFISDEKKRDHIRFSVKDTGVGIPKEFHETIFESFSRTDDLSSRKFGGIGMGLSISKRLVEKMGSRLLVESEEGEGSNFFFDIDLPSTASQSPSHGSNQIDLGVLNKNFAKRFPLKILAVEDNLINLKVLLKMLQNLGYEDVLSATSGESAIALLENEKADLIFMDLHMPGIDGTQTTKIIRSQEQKNTSGDPVQILALTANLSSSVREKCFAAGMNYYIGKPFNTRSLAEGILLSLQNKVA